MDYPEWQCKLNVVKLKFKSTIFEIIHPQISPDDYTYRDFDRYKKNHMAFTVKNIRKVYEELSEIGHYYIHPTLSPDCKAMVAFCRDPSGHMIELVEEL